MRLLLTRPEAGDGEADPLGAALAAAGHEILSAPLLRVVPTGAEPSLAGAQAIIATSRNSLKALSETSLADARRLALFAVGPATAALGRRLGFSRVVEGPGWGQALEATIRAEIKPQAGPLVYLSGAQIAFDLAAALTPHGYTVQREVLYRTEPAPRLPSEVGEALRAGHLDGVILMSPRTAMVYSELIRQADLVPQASGIVHFCLSEAVGRALAPLGPIRLAVARLPNSQEMLALVTRNAPDSH